jgi:hypothetical protein
MRSKNGFAARDFLNPNGIPSISPGSSVFTLFRTRQARRRFRFGAASRRTSAATPGHPAKKSSTLKWLHRRSSRNYESQRDSINQPRVGPSRTGEELPWAIRPKSFPTPTEVASPFHRAWIQQPFNRSGVSAERRILPLHYIFQMAAFSRKPLRGAAFTPLHDSHRTHVEIFPRLPLSPVEAGGEIWGEYFLCYLAGF